LLKEEQEYNQLEKEIEKLSEIEKNLKKSNEDLERDLDNNDMDPNKQMA